MDRATAYTSPRYDVADLVPRSARRILELGCSTGATAALIKRRQAAEVVGIERDVTYAQAASAAVDRLLILDLENPAWSEQIEGVFDCIVAADVLEHLVDPWTVLQRAARRLAPGGSVVLSLPNVRHVQTVAGLLAGRWPYRDRGVHDSTHLRFFTLRELRGLCAAAGLEVDKIIRNYRLFDRPSAFDRFAAATAWTPLRELFTYQYLVRGRSTDGGARPPRESVPDWVDDA